MNNLKIFKFVLLWFHVYIVSFGHYVVCSSSIYGFWLPLWYLQTLLYCYNIFGYHLTRRISETMYTWNHSNTNSLCTMQNLINMLDKPKRKCIILYKHQIMPRKNLRESSYRNLLTQSKISQPSKSIALI
jgi:hypothetical protein